MLEIQKVDSKNVWKILQPEVDENQKKFVATNTESIVEAYATGKKRSQASCFKYFHNHSIK